MRALQHHMDRWFPADGLVIRLSLAIVIVCFVFTLDIPIRAVLNQTQETDFKSFYLAFKAVSLGEDLYDIDVLTRLARPCGFVSLEPPWPYLYPPVFAFVLAPLSRLSFQTAALIWMYAGILAFAGAAAVHVRTLYEVFERRRGTTRGRRELLSVLAVFSVALMPLVPFRSNLHLGQVNLFVLAFIIFSFHAYVNGRDRLSGAMLSVAILIKVTPALLLAFFLVRRRYRIVASTLACLGLLVVATLPLGTGPAWLEFLKMSPKMGYGQFYPGLFSPALITNFSLAGLASRVFDLDVGLIRPIVTGVVLALLAPALLIAARARCVASAYVTLLAMTGLMVIAAPITYMHHVVYLYPGAVAACAYIWTRAPARWRVPWLIGLLCLLHVSSMNWMVYLYPRLPLEGPIWKATTSINLYALLALYASPLLLVTRPPAQAPRPVPPLGARPA